MFDISTQFSTFRPKFEIFRKKCSKFWPTFSRFLFKFQIFWPNCWRLLLDFFNQPKFEILNLGKNFQPGKILMLAPYHTFILSLPGLATCHVLQFLPLASCLLLCLNFGKEFSIWENINASTLPYLYLLPASPCHLQ